MITEDYVSFEIAKLLKENGFEGVCIRSFYDETAANNYYEECKKKHLPYDSDENKQFLYSQPTLQTAMKWLREVHRLQVEVVPNPFNFEHQDIQDGWGCEVIHLSDLSYDSDYEFFQKKYSTYEEACEAAIKYCLENLI